jgi:hypothetical protein
MKLSNNKCINFNANEVVYDNYVYPIETFSRAKTIEVICDNINNPIEKKKLLNTCWHFYFTIAKQKASKHHAGCRYAVKQRDGKNVEYGIYKKILETIKKLQLEVCWERNNIC